MLFRHGRCENTRTAKPEYGGYQGEGYEAGDDCAEVSVLSWATFPYSGQKVARHTGYCLAKI